MLKDLLRKGDYMIKTDLKVAYLMVPIWQNHQRYLWFLWRDSLLEFACLPFGLASAPTKLLKPVLSILRQRGIRLIVYLDDILLMAPSFLELSPRRWRPKLCRARRIIQRTRRGVHFAVVSDKMDLSSSHRCNLPCRAYTLFRFVSIGRYAFRL